jgi:hypothetical protein
VSLLTRKDPSSGRDSGSSQNLLNSAAQQVAPIARSAGQAYRQGVEGARGWVMPRVQGARSWAEPQVRVAASWAAPRVEQAGVAVREKIAPTVSAAFFEASRRLDAAAPQPEPQAKRRLWPRLLAGAAMLAAAASAAAAVFLKRQADMLAGSEDQSGDGQVMPPAGQPGGATPAPGPGARREGDGMGEGMQA